MTIEFHSWNTPNGRKISVALEEMGLPYRVIPVNIAKGEQMSPSFLAISPNNKIPAIVDPDGPEGSRSASSNPAPSCSISARRPASSCPSHW
jgi:GSH-dependent disulfide-bond oxidoreductase